VLLAINFVPLNRVGDSLAGVRRVVDLAAVLIRGRLLRRAVPYAPGMEPCGYRREWCALTASPTDVRYCFVVGTVELQDWRRGARWGTV
jgi:hypothetical protein